MAKTEFKTTFSIEDKASSPLSKIIDKLSSLGKGADKALDDLNELTQTSFAPLKNSLNTVSKTFTDATGKTTTLTREIKKVESSAGSINKVANSASKAGSAISKIKATALQKIKGVADNVKNSIEGVGNKSEETNSKLSGLAKSLISIGTAYTAIKAVKGTLNWTDELTQTSSRLNLVNKSFNELNGTQQTTRELQDKIFQAAQASRGSYQGLQEMVAKLGNSAKSSFKDTDAIVDFGSTMNKIFALSGASAEEMNSSILQLSQALSSGVLQGDEFKSLTETNPVFLDYLAQGMGVARENLKEMGSEGQLTSQAIVNAMTKMSGEISAQFLQLQPTFGNVWTYFTNTAQHAFEPVAAELAKLAVDPQFQASLEQLGDTIASLAPKIKDLVSGFVSSAPDVIQKLVDGFSWIVDNGSTLGTVVISLGAAFGTLSIISSIASMMTALGVAITIPLAPIALVIAGIAGLVAGLVWLWNTNEGFRNAVTGIWNGIKDTIINVWNSVMGFFEWLPNEWNAEITRLQELGTAIANIFIGWCDSAIKWGSDLLDSFKNGLIDGWNNVTSTVSNWWNEAVSWGKNVIEGFKKGLQDAWSGVTSWVTDSFNWIVDKAKGIFQIGSPSKVFNGIGGDLVQGFHEGIASKWTGVESWFTAKTKGLISTENGLLGSINPYSGLETQKPPQMDLTFDTEPVEPIFNPDVLQTDQLTKMCETATTEFSGMTSTTLSLLSNMQTTGVSTTSLMYTTLINLTTTFSNTFITLWTNIRNTLIASVNSLCATVLARFVKLDNDIITETNRMPPAMKKLGTDMMTSLIAGINSQSANVQSTADSLVQQLKNTFQSGLGIHSPSDFMIWIGQMMLAGLIEGMSSSQIQSFIESMINDMQSSFENGKFNANELVNFLSDDATLNLIGKITGMDLGGMNPEQIAYPLVGTMGTISSYFGNRESPGGIGSTNHQGMDLAAPTGTPIAAALGGTATTAGWYGGYGNAVVIDSGGGLSIVYGHMSKILAQQGQAVQKGQQIGLVGSTGNSTGPHLHFEMRQDGTAFDPYDYLMGASISAGNTLANAIQMAYNAKHGIISLGNYGYDVSAGAAQWTPQVLQALAMLGQPASLLQGVLYAIDSESGGNPNAINLWDSNSATDPSRGLLQTIGATFNAYRNPSLSANIYDPLSNIYAGLNYMIQRYGSVANVINPRMGGWYGYAVGTRYVPSDMLAMIHEGEAIIPASQNPYSQSGGDYLADIADNFVATPFDAEPYLASTSTSSAVSVGDINTTVNVSGTNADPNEIARRVSEQILYDMEVSMSTKAGVQRGY